MDFKTEPMKHQYRELVERAYPVGYYGADWGMGSGKTKFAIDFCRWQYKKHGGFLRTLVIAPPIALLNWRDEIYKHSNSGNQVIVLNQRSTKQRLKALEIGLSQGKNFVVCNYEGLRFIEKELLAVGFRIVIADESHKIKNPSGKATKVCHKLSKKAEFRICLSGTPIPNSALDIWSQMYFLDHGKLLGERFTVFRAMNFMDENACNPHIKYPKYVLIPSRAKVIQEAIDKVWGRVKKEECLDLPPRVDTKITLQMPEPQRRMSEKLIKEYICMLEDGDKAVIANNAAAKQIRLSQICSGFYRTDDGDDVYFKENPKLDAIKDIMENTNEKMVIWACWRPNIIQLLEELKEYNPASIWGDTKSPYEQERKFEEDKTCRLIICNQQSASEAINLIQASLAFYYSQRFDLRQRLQSEARGHRKGSEIHDRVIIYDPIFEKSIDEIIAESLKYKYNMAEALLDKKLWAKIA